jgi:hypothetical protein
MKKRGMKKDWFKHHKDEEGCSCHCASTGACGGSIYFIGFIGAAVYYLQQSTTFWTGVLGILKALVWPAFLVYKLLG